MMKHNTRQLDSFEKLVSSFIYYEKNFLERIVGNLYYDKFFSFYISVIIHLICEQKEDCIKILVFLITNNSNIDIRYLFCITNSIFIKKVEKNFKCYKRLFNNYFNSYK